MNRHTDLRRPFAGICALLGLAFFSCTKQQEAPHRNFWTIDNQVHGCDSSNYQFGLVQNLSYHFLNPQTGDSVMVLATIGSYTGEQSIIVVNSSERPMDSRALKGVMYLRAFSGGTGYEYTGPGGVYGWTKRLDTIIGGQSVSYDVLPLSSVRLENPYNRNEAITLSGRLNLSRRSQPQLPANLILNGNAIRTPTLWNTTSCEWVLGYSAGAGSTVELRFSSRPVPGARFRFGIAGCESPEGIVDMRYHHDADAEWYRPSYDSAMLGRELVVEDVHGMMKVSLQNVSMKEPNEGRQVLSQNGSLSFRPF